MARRLTIGLLIEVEGTYDIEGYKTVMRLGIAVVPLLFRECPHRYEPLPIVAAGSPHADYPSVCVDNRSGIESLCRHLFEYHQCKNPIFIAGPRENPEAKARLEVYREMLARHGLPEDPQRIREGAFTVETGRRAVCEIRSQPDLFCDAMVCANDHMALGAILELTQLGVDIPGEIAVTGFDDDAKALAALPPLTTVRQPIYEIGREAAKMILHWIRSGEKPKNVLLPTRLVTRQSCGWEEDVYGDFQLLA